MKGLAPVSGLFASLRRLLATTLEIAQVRLGLLGTEIELEKRRLFDGLLWAAVALLLLGIGLVLSCGFIILLFWDGYRLMATGGMTLLFLVGGVLLLREARQRLRNPAGMFSSSVSELQKDRAELQDSVQHEPP
jgi:uncharacterized membrane protein YqjE